MRLDKRRWIPAFAGMTDGNGIGNGEQQGQGQGRGQGEKPVIPAKAEIQCRSAAVTRWILVFLATPVLLLSVTTALSAQASPSLDPDHWAVAAARRAEALGLVEGYLPSERSVSREVVAEALAEAAASAGDEWPQYLPLLKAWQARFAEEFGAVGEAWDGLALLSGSGQIGYRARDGAAAPGLAEFPPERTGALPLEDRSDLLVGANLAAAIGDHLVVAAEPRASLDEFYDSEWEIVAGWRRLSASIGRQPVGYGYGVGGGVLLSGAVPINRIEIETSQSVILPGILRYAGPFALHLFFGEMDDDRHPADPFIWGARASIRPHPRFTASASRAGFFGGNRSDRPVTFGNIFNMLLGRVEGGSFENQLFSAEFRYRLPTERVIPATVYLEWGMEDAAGAIRDVPGRVMGIWVPAVPGVPALAVGYENASFAESCCGNPEWYRHQAFPGSWSGTEVPLGHPLGGHGTESLVYATLDLLESRLRVQGDTFWRDRGSENLYVPGRAGESSGFSIELAGRVTSNAEVELVWSRESGDGWAENRFRTAARMFF
ncbi:MAG TPA: capsule assembly Wzi family protein [Longimicrobiaceae bacterium]|nr:capsule assembly Wzi family protein [Longimicrobiaceae bacterium]